MNKHIVKGKMKELKGEVKERFGKATDQPLTQLGGKKDKLAGKIQQEYGKAKHEAVQEIDDEENAR